MVEFDRRKPFGITVAMVFLGLLASLGSVAGLANLLTSLFGEGPFLMNGVIVPRHEFLRFALPFILFYLSLCTLAGAAAWSIHVEHPRSRPLLLIYAASLVFTSPWSLALGVPAADVASSTLSAALVTGLVWFYLYRKKAVVQYYDAIRIAQMARPERH